MVKLGSKKLGGKKLAKPHTNQGANAASEPELEPEPEPEPEPEQKPEGSDEQDGDGWDDDGDGWPEDAQVATVVEPDAAAEAEVARENRLDQLTQPETAPGAGGALDATPQTEAEPAPVLDDFADAPDVPDDFDDAPDFDDDF